MIDRSCLLYGVTEEHILRTWSIETLNRKYAHALEYDFRRRFPLAKEKDEQGENDELTAEELTSLLTREKRC
ncbi:MAG: hypothetical protein HC888_09330 [Candidatus Competibacteraceae bacterium]|nr:hypothetical protein [Candidatus Competibacteraceae bacterium]